MLTFRSVLASIILVVLWAAPAYPTALAIDPLTPTTLYAGTSDRGVYKSTDGGSNWSATGLTSVFVTALAIDSQTPSIVYAGTIGGGVFKSADGGASWSAINTGLSNLNVTDLVIDPQTPATLYALITEYYACEVCPITSAFKTTNGGATWSVISMPPENWLGTPVRIVTALAIDPKKTSVLYAGVYYVPSPGYSVFAEVLKSTDGGASWISTGLTEVDGWFGALAIDPQTPSTVYVGGIYNYGIVYKSADGGASWGSASVTGLSCDDSVQALAIDPLAATTLYAVLPCSGVFKSADGGATWSAVGTGLTGDLVIDPLNPTTLYAGTGTFKSTDGGATWNPTGLLHLLLPLTSVSFNPTSVTGGTASTGTVTLSAAAPAGGATIAISSSNTAVATVPANVTVPAGATSATFTISTNPVAASIAVTISATYSGVTKSANFTVNPAITFLSLSLNPTSVTGGTASTGTVTLSAAAPAGGATIVLSNSNTAAATVPANVTVPAGAASATFSVATSPVNAFISVTISGTYSGVTRSAALTVTPATTLSAVSLNPTSVTPGNISTGTVILNMAAPAGGAVVTLSSSDAAIATVPASVTVAAGVSSMTFTVSTVACNSGSVTISGTYGGLTRSAGLTVTVPATDTVAIQQADYLANRHELRVAATSTGSTATLQVYVTSTGELIGTLKPYDGNRYSGRFTWPVNPQNISVRSSLCGSATRAVGSR